MEIEPPLWDSDARRLTLLFEPGRIKRVLRQHVDLGLPLVDQAGYRLVIHSKMSDAEGQPLGLAHEKQFRVTSPDRQSPDSGAWKLAAPGARSRQGLSLRLSEPLDYALLHTMIDVYRNGERIDGDVAVGKDEAEWTFTPHEPGEPGSTNCGSVFCWRILQETGSIAYSTST